MEKISSLHLRRLHGRLGEIAYELTRLQFGHFSGPESWFPLVNAYKRDLAVTSRGPAGLEGAPRSCSRARAGCDQRFVRDCLPR